MKRWLPWLGLSVSVFCIVYFVRTVAEHWQSLTQTSWQASTFIAIGIALVLYVATYFVASRSWQLVFGSMSQEVSFTVAAGTLMLSQFAKYLPGNVGHHVGRYVLAKRAGLSGGAIVTSIFVDTILVLTAGAACSIPAISILVQVLQDLGVSAFKAIALIGLSAAALTLTMVMIPLVRTKFAELLRKLAGLGTFSSIKPLAMAWACHCINFMLGATAVYLLGSALAEPHVPPNLSHLLEVLGIYAAAWLLGLLMPGAPAGLGIRELVLLLGLSPIFGEQNAAATAAFLRLVTTAGDGAAFLIGLSIRRRESIAPSSSP